MLSPLEYQHLLRHDLVSFTERAFYELNPTRVLLLAPYIELIATKLEACRRGEIKRLAIALPPRHLKSHCASVAFVASYLGHHAERHVICVSYGQELAERNARDCRRVVQSTWYQALFATRLSDRLAVHDFDTHMGGTRLATSVGGVLTGRGADLIIIDDPLKPDEALSEVARKGVNDWYDRTLLPRLNDKEKGCIIIVMQRLHQDDLIGHVLEQEDWDVVCLPAIAVRRERHVIQSPLGRWVYSRKPGEVLDPRRESRATLKKLRSCIGEYNFAAQYQQDPVPVEGNLIRKSWLRYFEPGEDFRGCTIVQSWDTANKPGEFNDFSVCSTWAVKDGLFYLLDIFRRKLAYPDLKRSVADLRNRFRPSTILIEDMGSGMQLIPDLRRDGIACIRAYKPPTGSGKRTRLNTQSAVFESGRVLLPRQAHWLADYIAELTSFPGAKFDDQVDSTTQALEFLQARPLLHISDLAKELANKRRS